VLKGYLGKRKDGDGSYIAGMMVVAESSKCKTDGVKPAVFERLA